MKVTVKTEPNCKRVLEIEIPKEDVEAEFNDQVLQYRSKAKIPGFRPGKAPKDLVKSRFLDNIKADMLDALIPKTLEQALTQENIIPLTQPELSDLKYDDNKPITFSAVVEIKPEVDLKDYIDLELTRKVEEVTDAKVEEALADMQKRYAELFPVERPCHEDDIVIVDLIKKFDKLGKLKEDKMEDVEIDMGAEKILKEFKENLRGMSIGEMKEIDVKYPEDYSDKRLAGNEMRYTAVVKEIKEKKLPPLDDEFAVNFAKLDSLEQLKSTMKESLIRKANEGADNALKSSIINKIIENHRFEIPESLIEKYLQSVTEDFKKRYEDVDELELRQSFRRVGEDTIRWQFIYLKIANKDNIKVTEEDRIEWIKLFAAAYNMSEQTARETLGKAGKFDEIDDTLLEKKVLDFIKDNSKITS